MMCVVHNMNLLLPCGACFSSAQEMSDSRQYVGNNPIPLPWMWGPAGSGGSNRQPDKPFGHWFSTPRESECAVGTPFGTDPPGCTWQQKPQVWVMYTKDLIKLGYDGNTVNMVRLSPSLSLPLS